MTKAQPAQLQSEATRKLALQALDELKANQVVALDVRDRASFTDYMIIASGTSSRHVSAIASAVIEAAAQAGLPAPGVAGDDVGEWVLFDLGDAIVHVMLPDVRQYYELEKLWGEELQSE